MTKTSGKFIYAAVIFLFFIAPPVPAIAGSNLDVPGERIFIDRPWAIRHFLYVDDAGVMKIRQEVAAASNREDGKHNVQPVYLRVEHLFNTTTILKTANIHLPGDDYLGLVKQ